MCRGVLRVFGGHAGLATPCSHLHSGASKLHVRMFHACVHACTAHTAVVQCTQHTLRMEVLLARMTHQGCVCVYVCCRAEHGGRYGRQCRG